VISRRARLSLWVGGVPPRRECFPSLPWVASVAGQVGAGRACRRVSAVRMLRAAMRKQSAAAAHESSGYGE
jgi:uncharacterized membrane protein